LKVIKGVVVAVMGETETVRGRSSRWPGGGLAGARAAGKYLMLPELICTQLPMPREFLSR